MGRVTGLAQKVDLSGWLKTSGSRLANSVLISTMSPVFMVASPICTSRVTVRRILTTE